MVVIYAEKSSLATDIASALHAGKRIPLKDEPTVGYWNFTYEKHKEYFLMPKLVKKVQPKAGLF